MSNYIFRAFGLRENPFSISPDPRYIFPTPQTQSTWAELTYAISTRKGLILLTGEVGTGKTTMVRRLIEWLSNQRMPTAMIFNSRVDADHLLDFVLADFEIPCQSNLKSDKLIHLNRWLLERYRAGQTPVLIVDEAQGLPPNVLEQIRLLLNFETPRDKLLQIVLAGQPELEEKLKRSDLRQLRQRITIRCKTAPLTREETHDYVAARLHQAGGTSLFEMEAIDRVYRYSNGIPRVVNLLCEHALIHAYASQESVVSPHAVVDAAQDCQLEESPAFAPALGTDTQPTFRSTPHEGSIGGEDLQCHESPTPVAGVQSLPLPTCESILYAGVESTANSQGVAAASSTLAEPEAVAIRYSASVVHDRPELQTHSAEVPTAVIAPLVATSMLSIDADPVPAISIPSPQAQSIPETEGRETRIPRPARRNGAWLHWFTNQFSRLGRCFAAADRKIQATFSRTWLALHRLSKFVHHNTGGDHKRLAVPGGAKAHLRISGWVQQRQAHFLHFFNELKHHPRTVALLQWLSEPVDSQPQRPRKQDRSEV